MTNASAKADWMIYGANGYTGRLITALALARGQRPVLAGRDAERLAEMGRETGLPVRIFDLQNLEVAARSVADMRVVLHAAGPFSKTARPMLQAMMRAGRRGSVYLDITGEIEVFEMARALSPTLVEHGVAAIPGVGFDVVPSDCLAALTKERLPDAMTLRLAFHNRGGGISPGTAKTMLETAKGRVRRNGVIEVVPTAHATLRFTFPSGAATAVSIPWGDVSTAFHSTGIPNIETYMAVPAAARRSMRLMAKTEWLMAFAPVRSALQGLIGRYVKGPDAASRARASSEFVAEVTNDQGEVARLGLKTPEGYSLTADTALRAVEKCLATPPSPGFHTPSTAFGAKFILEAEGTQLVELR